MMDLKLKFNVKMALFQNGGLRFEKIKKWRSFKMAESANSNLKFD